MKIAFFDTIAGISGDMTLGAFISAGLSIDTLIENLKKLKLSGYEISARHVDRNGITAIKVDVDIVEQPKYKRHLSDINRLIEESDLSDFVKNTSKNIFHEIAVAEAKVHNSTVEKAHFHEVGAVDSLIDIIGASIALEYFQVEGVYSSPVKIGHGGFIKTQHGVMPIPSPATIEILKGYPTILTEINFELTTPTGAAIIKALSKGVLTTEQLRISAIGYGSGSVELESIPNLLRVMIGDIDDRFDSDELVSIETNIDDMNPELYPYVLESLFKHGAQDAYLTQTIMKKGRPGILLSVLSPRSNIDRITHCILSETSTLGVRIHPVERKKLKRSNKKINTSLGMVEVKVVLKENKEFLIPEFEECKRIALKLNRPLIEVYQILERDLRRDL